MSSSIQIDNYSNTSRCITMLRFPLAILVVFLHWEAINPAYRVTIPMHTILSNFNLENLSYVMRHLCKFGGIVVPLFFFFSGMLFYNKCQKLTFKEYGRKLKSRFFTLLIPYITWNSLTILFKSPFYPFNFSSSYWENASNTIINSTFIPNNYLSPSLGVLWFIEALIILSILSPLFYILAKKLPLLGLILILSLNSLYPHTIFSPLNMESICYFYLGIALSSAGWEKIETLKRYFTPFLICSVLSLIYYFFLFPQQWSPYSENMYSVIKLLLCTSTFLGCYKFCGKYSYNLPPILPESSMFIYCWHLFPVLGGLAFIQAILPEYFYHGGLGAIMYWTMPFVVVALGVLLSYLIQKYSKLAKLLLLGSR